MEPFYIHMPSVRPAVLGTVGKWFVHAAQAKGAKVSAAAREAGAQAQSERVRMQLVKIANRLEKRKPEKLKNTGDIHLVVADVSPLYQMKPSGQTHTPALRELARRLNEIGNAHGVFVHHISVDEIAPLLPRQLPKENDHPWVHQDKNGNRFVGPGAGTNIALSYISAFHRMQYGDQMARLLRMSDDTFPAVGKMWGNYRNFFKDHEPMGTLYSTSYRGYYDNKGERIVRPSSYRYTHFIIRRMNPVETRYYMTNRDEDLAYEAPLGTESMRVGGLLIHAGKQSTYNFRDPTGRYFGEFGEYRRKVEPVGKKTLFAVLKANGIGRPKRIGGRRKDGANRDEKGR